MHTITKTFGWIYGHRLHKQNIAPCLCRNLHGHSGTLSLSFEGGLNDGMILDFNRIKDFKTEFELYYDHKMLLCEDDPLVKSWIERYELWSGKLRDYGFETSALDSGLEGVEKEFFDSIVLCPFEPTSENLSEWIFRYVNHWLECVRLDSVWCSEVRLWETESSGAVYKP